MKIGGLPVRDAKESVTIKINAADVKNGNRKDAGGCAAALACKRQFHATDARVHIGRIYIKQDKEWVRYVTPESLRTEIIAFDRGGEFFPTEHKLRKVPPADMLGKRRKGSNRWKRGPHKTKAKHPARYICAGVRKHGANI